MDKKFLYSAGYVRKAEIRDFYKSIHDIGEIYDVELENLVGELDLDLELEGDDYPIGEDQNIRDHTVATWTESYGIALDIKGYEDRGLPGTMKENALETNEEIQINEPYRGTALMHYGQLMNIVSEDLGRGDGIPLIEISRKGREEVFEDLRDLADTIPKLEPRKPI